MELVSAQLSREASNRSQTIRRPDAEEVDEYFSSLFNPEIKARIPGVLFFPTTIVQRRDSFTINPVAGNGISPFFSLYWAPASVIRAAASAFCYVASNPTSVPENLPNLGSTAAGYLTGGVSMAPADEKLTFFNSGLGAPAPAAAHRMVSARLRIRYVGRESDISGVIRYGAQLRSASNNNNQPLFRAPSDYAPMFFPTATTLSAKREIDLLYLPLDGDDFVFKPINTAYLGDAQPLSWNLTGYGFSGTPSFEVEIIYTYEIISGTRSDNATYPPPGTPQHERAKVALAQTVASHSTSGFDSFVQNAVKAVSTAVNLAGKIGSFFG